MGMSVIVLYVREEHASYRRVGDELVGGGGEGAEHGQRHLTYKKTHPPRTLPSAYA